MAFDQNKDKLIKLFEMKKEKGSLLAAVMSYNGGEEKLQISRNYPKQDGSLGYSGMGRLTKDEVEWIIDNSSDILKAMNK